MNQHLHAPATDPKAAWREAYDAAYARSIDDAEAFWLETAREKLEWIAESTQALRGGFENLDYTWFADGVLNVSANCLDRHVNTWRGTKAGGAGRDLCGSGAG